MEHLASCMIELMLLKVGISALDHFPSILLKIFFFVEILLCNTSFIIRLILGLSKILLRNFCFFVCFVVHIAAQIPHKELLVPFGHLHGFPIKSITNRLKFFHCEA